MTKVGKQNRNRLRGQLWDELGDQLRGQLWDQLRDQLGDQLWYQLWIQLRGQLRDRLVGCPLWGKILSQIQEELHD